MESIFPGGRPIPSKSYQFNDKLKLVIKRAFSNTHTHTQNGNYLSDFKHIPILKRGKSRFPLK